MKKRTQKFLPHLPAKIAARRALKQHVKPQTRANNTENKGKKDEEEEEEGWGMEEVEVEEFLNWESADSSGGEEEEEREEQEEEEEEEGHGEEEEKMEMEMNESGEMQEGKEKKNKKKQQQGSLLRIRPSNHESYDEDDDAENEEEEEDEDMASGSDLQENEEDFKDDFGSEIEDSDIEDEELDSDLASENEDGNDEDQANGAEGVKANTTDKRQIITKVIAKKWLQEVKEKKSLKALRCLVNAFRSATDYNNENEAKEDGKRMASKYRIESATVFNAVLQNTFDAMQIALEHFIGKLAIKNKKYASPIAAENYKSVQTALRSFAFSVPSLLATISEESTLDLLDRLKVLLPYLSPYPKPLKLILKTLMRLWSNASTTKLAFDCMMVMAHIPTSLPLLLKGAYLHLVMISKNTTPHNIAQLDYMVTCISKIYAVDDEAAYVHAYVYIRMLAVQLRNTLRSISFGKVKKDGNDPVRGLQSWGVVWSVKVWATVLSSVGFLDRKRNHGPVLKELIYPFIQILLGILGMSPSTNSLPFRLHMLQSLVFLARDTHTYIPLFPYFYSILSSPLFTGQMKPSTSPAICLAHNIKVLPALVQTRPLFDAAFRWTGMLFLEWLNPWTSCLSFPELVIAINTSLRRLMKENTNGKFGKWCKEVTQTSERISKRIVEDRDEFDGASADVLDKWETDKRQSTSEFSDMMKRSWQSLEESEGAAIPIAQQQKSKKARIQ